MLDPRDALLQESCPVVPVPVYGQPDPMTEPGQRILLAANGVFVNAKRDWVDTIQQIGQIDGFRLPYGQVAETLSLACGALPVALLARFIDIARGALPNETAAALVWSRTRHTLRLAHCQDYRASPEHVSYARLRLADHSLGDDEDVLLDLHSHARLPAFFSGVDDADDRGFKLCGVVGDLYDTIPSAAFRLCINGYYTEPPLPWDSDALPWRAR